MTTDDEFPPLTDYISVKEAATLLGIAESRVYGYITKGSLPAQRLGERTYAIPIKGVEALKTRLNPPGRKRKAPPKWREYTSRNKVLGTDIQVKIRAELAVEHARKMLDAKFQQLYKEGLHTFTGTIARYVFLDRQDPALLNIWLVWKNTEMPDEETREQEMEAFKAEFADVLDWETAQFRDKEGLAYT